MLLDLQVRDFVIVDHCELSFDAGFTVFSGETGAGKSILIDALALTLGERAEAAMVRAGAVKADIAASFSTSRALDAWLAEHDVIGDPGTVILRRTIDAQGRSKGFINGSNATQAMLRECGDMLVDIHGQHAHQQLLRPAAQRALLDTHGGAETQANAVRAAWQAWAAIREQRVAFERDARSIIEQRERLQWQLDELIKLAPQTGEWDAISAEHQRLAHAANLITGAQAAVDALAEQDAAVQTLLGGVLGKLRPLVDIDPTLKNAVEALDGAEAQISDAVSTLNSYLARTEIDPERLAEIDLRMQALHSAARKFRLPADELPQWQVSLEQQLQSLDQASDIESLLKREEQAKHAYQAEAKKLTTARKKIAKALGDAVTEAMQTLSMTGGRFAIQLVEREPSAHGNEDIEFHVAGHAGVELRPLNKVASGGELARISLAISVITSSANATPTLIFDEVDSGIGGGVAEVVGRLLKQLGQSRQVLCVTHLPQVASKGDQHFAVSKTTVGQRTTSQIHCLSAAERVEEIARMLGGLAITPTTRKAASEMLVD